MRRASALLFNVLIVLSLCIPAEAQGNFCMDCIQRQVKHDEDPEHIWFESDGMCCMLPCAGYGGYEVRDEDIGCGCFTTIVNNALVQGDICNPSTTEDQGCPQPPPPQEEIQHNGSPILLDLGTQGYRLTSVQDGVQFDLRNERRRPRMAWTRLGVENAFLAMDRNRNGQIDNGSELFGNYTPLRSGRLARNGFEVLAELDANQDGTVDRRDRVWSALLLWTDRNHDGWSTPDEIQPIANSTVAELSTEYRRIGRKDQWGNQFLFMSRFRFQRRDAEPQRTYYDVFFRIEP
jgi:hypothetical protein